LCVVFSESDLQSYLSSTVGQSAGWLVQVAVIVCIQDAALIQSHCSSL